MGGQLGLRQDFFGWGRIGTASIRGWQYHILALLELLRPA